MYHSGIPPLVAGATTFPPQFGGAAKGKRLNGQARRLTSPHLEVLCRTSTVALWVLSHGAMSLQESIETYSAPLAGAVRRSRIGGGERSEPVSRMFFMPYDKESKSRNADFISIALRAIRNPRPERPSNLRTLRPQAGQS